MKMPFVSRKQYEADLLLLRQGHVTDLAGLEREHAAARRALHSQYQDVIRQRGRHIEDLEAEVAHLERQLEEAGGV